MIMTSKLLAARRSLRSTEWDGADLDHWIQIMCRLDARVHGFGAADVRDVECAWSEAHPAGWSGGFVARLKDGRRAGIGATVGLRHWTDGASLEVALVEGQERRDEIAARFGWAERSWSEPLARQFNEMLSRCETPPAMP